MNIQNLQDWFHKYSNSSLSGRYIHLDHISPILNELSQSSRVEVSEIGFSEDKLPIYLLKLGKGTKKLLFWSQMHGNESTTTKAVVDFLHLLIDPSNDIANTILENCTLYIIPILSPDGAKTYTRLNHNKVDLNRDAQDRTQKESNVLDKLIKDIQPDVAFNLHGQRTIFAVGATKYPATVSFLSPAGDHERTITADRKIAMEIISKMNDTVQQFIPNQVGRYDDSFNINCVGDTLANRGIPTILFEAGHYPDDWDRDKTRSFIFYALLVSSHFIATNVITGQHYKDYFLIPENEKLFYDIIIRNVILDGKNVDIAIQYEEKLIDNHINFLPKVAKIGALQNYIGHKEILGQKRVIQNENVTVEIVPSVKLLKFHLDSELFLIESIKS
ncbi:M14 family zinc carboxypeptidase [Aquimarina algicola]|uniref:Peptidase M14 n=1 Tax=Aquimarina algicola TaxID=2589995 RepID=A0A504JMN5_9FLAO|nr:M14 family zinc carboxypeptidase [Aquimarina algicola]TPN89048.1 peptidase M14 [Aquimarina algicola]